MLISWFNVVAIYKTSNTATWTPKHPLASSTQALEDCNVFVV